ncbi:trimethylamine methyltransferase family protein [Coralliovum pocilloporae]|uniref:trimethylamine methyltransferase family protein n=1 Tax=Coralliovum pocilloporae TaxID=3066369 RepID=UPI003307063D
MSEVAEEKKSRRGGRNARRAERAAPLPEELRPVRAGLEGGTFKPLSEMDVVRINEAVMDVLETIGMADAIPSCVEACTAIGAIYGDDGRLRFPRSLVEEIIASANRDFTLHGFDPKHDMSPKGHQVYYGTAGAAVHTVDVENRTYRDSTVQDLYDAARIVEGLDNVHFFQRPLTTRDTVDPLDMDINTLYASLRGTTKHVGTSITTPENAEQVLKMLHVIAGGEDKWRARPFVSNSNCFVVPPMKFAEDASAVLEVCVRGDMPVLLLSAGQAGATAPASIAGAVVQAVAEVLAGLIYVNAIKKGAPAIFGTWPFVSDLRTGAMSGGSGEQALLSSACAQMARYYDLIGGAATGMCDAKLPDMQAGYERGISNVMTGLAGLNFNYESVGMYASLLGFSLESLIIDNDLLGQALRCVRGIEVTEDSLSIEAIRQVTTEGPGHYLGHDQTISLMQTEYVYPVLGDRSSPKEWVEKGRPDLIEEAVKMKNEILSTRFPSHISNDIDDALRDQFNIVLPKEAVGR